MSFSALDRYYVKLFQVNLDFLLLKNVWTIFIFQTKNYQLVFVAYNAKHAELRRKSKDWLLRNQDNVSEWSDMYIRELLFPLANTIKKN
jgi:hypothetical protein